MNRKFLKISNITQIFVWSLVLILAIMSVIFIGIDSFGGDTTVYALFLGWLANVSVFPFALPIMSTLGAIASPVVVFIAGVLLVGVIVWFLICAILNTHKRSNSESQSIISFGVGIAGLIFSAISLLFVLEITYTIPTLITSCLLVAFFVYIVVIEFVNIRKKV